MFKSVWDDIVNYFRTGNVIARIILINIAIFIGVNIMSVFMTGSGLGPSFDEFLKFFSASADLKYLAFHPWGVFTCIFLHADFFHILFNMIWLYAMGRIAGDLLGDRRMLSLYVMGGVFGALTFVAFSQIIGMTHAYSLGASGAVMAITVAAGVTAPEYRISLIFFETKLKFLVVAVLFLNIVGVFSMRGSGTDYFGHLGGAFFGWLYVYLLGRGTDLSQPFNRYWDAMVGFFQRREERPRRPQPKMAFKNKEKIKRNQSPGRQSDYSTPEEKLNAILDKINLKGKNSLTKEEQSFLDNYYNN